MKIYYPNQSEYQGNNYKYLPSDGAAMAESEDNLSFKLECSSDNGSHYTAAADLTGLTLSVGTYDSATGVITVPRSGNLDGSGNYSVTISGLPDALYRVNDVKGGTFAEGSFNNGTLTVTADGHSKYFARNNPIKQSADGDYYYDTYVRNIFLGKEITIKKVWDDGDNADGLRPELLDITLNEKIQSTNENVQVTKLLKNDDKWERTVLLPRYYYNGDLPLNNILFTVSENLETAKQYYNRGSSLKAIGYEQTDQGYIVKVGGGTNDVPHDFKNNLQGTNDDSFVGLYIKNHKEYVNSKLTFEKKWTDGESSLRPDSIYIKTLRRIKGSLLPDKNGVFTANPDEVDFSQITLFQELPQFYTVNTDKYPLVYFVDPSDPVKNKDVNSSGTVEVDLSDASGTTSFKLKRRVASYVYRTFIPDNAGLYEIPLDAAVNKNYSLKLKDLPIADNGINYTYWIVDNNRNEMEVDMKHIQTSDETKDIVFMPMNGDDPREYSAPLKFKLMRSSGVDDEGEPIPELVTGITAETYFEETEPLITYNAAAASDDADNELYDAAKYAVSTTEKYGDVYSLKIICLEPGSYRITNVASADGRSVYAEKTVTNDDPEFIFTVSDVQGQLTFLIQKKAENSDVYTDLKMDDVEDIKVGRYYEEVVKQDKNGTQLRLEYFPKNVETEVVEEDHYGNPIGYEDNAAGMKKTSTNGTFTIPASFAFDKKISVLVKGLDASYQYTVSYGTAIHRPAGDNKVDLLVTKTFSDTPTDFNFTVNFEETPPEGVTLPESLTAVRYFVSDENGIVKLPSSVAKSVAENLAYGISQRTAHSDGTLEYPSEHFNGLWEKYYYTVVECDKEGYDDQSSLTYSQTDDETSEKIYTAEKLTFTIDTSSYHKTPETTREYINIKIIDTGNNNHIVKKDIDGNALKLTMTSRSADGTVRVEEFYASDLEHNIPEEGVFVIHIPTYCDSVLCEVDGLPRSYYTGTDEWRTPTYAVERCKAGGKTHNDGLPLITMTADTDDNTSLYNSVQTISDSSVTYTNALLAQYTHPVLAETAFTYTKTWNEDSVYYKLRPDHVHFALFRMYDSDGQQHYESEYVMSLNKAVTSNKVTDTIVYGSDDTTKLPAGRWVNAGGNNEIWIWKPYSYYLKEYYSEYDNEHPDAAAEKSYNNLYKSEHIHETDKPFVLDTNTYTYAHLDQGLNNKLQKTKHEVLKVWDDMDNTSRSRSTYTIQLQSKTGQTNWTPVDLRNVVLASISTQEVTEDGETLLKKVYNRVPISSANEVYSYTVPYNPNIPQKNLNYSFDSLPVYDENGLEYSYRVVEKMIGSNSVNEKNTYLFLVGDENEYSYVRTIRRGTKDYYVDYEITENGEITDEEGTVYKPEKVYTSESNGQFTVPKTDKVNNTFSVRVEGLSDQYEYSVSDDDAVCVQEYADNGKVNLLITKTVSENDDSDFTFEIVYNDGTSDKTVKGSLKAYNTNNVTKYETETYGQSIITNQMTTNSVSFTNFEAKKIWDDENNLYGQRPESITYVLKRRKTLNGETSLDTGFASSKTVGEADDWEAKWKQCAAFAPDGGSFEYFVEEVGVDYYSTSEETSENADTKIYTFTNTYVPEKRTLTAYKKWDDQNDRLSTRPSTVTYELWCKYDEYALQYGEDENGDTIILPNQTEKTGSFDGLVYDPSKEYSEQSAVYRAMLAKYPALTGERAEEYFKRIIDSSFKDGTDDSLWKITFDDLPYKVNTCADGVHRGTSVSVTYYILETVDNTTKKLYLCPDKNDTRKSDEKLLLQYGQPYSTNSVTANSSDIISVPKSYSFNGVQSFEIPDLQSADIYGHQYRYYVKEVSPSGGTVRTEDSAFRDNTNGKTTILVTNELPKLYFKIQRKVDDKAEAQTVVKDKNDERLNITINDIVYTADSSGVFAVPRVYTGTGDNAKVLSANVTGLPQKRDDKRTYTYSVLECNADGTEKTVADTDKIKITETVSSGNVTLALSKPLGTESPNVDYQLYRRLKGKDYSYIVTGENNKAIEIVDETTHETTDAASIAMSASIDGKSDCIVEIPLTAGQTEPFKFKLRRTTDGKTYDNVTGITAVSTADGDITWQSGSNGVFTVPVSYAENSRLTVIVKELPLSENDGAEEGHLSQIVYEKLVEAESNCKEYPANKNNIIVVPNTAAVRKSVYVIISGLDKYFGGVQDAQHQYIYSVKECDSSGNEEVSSDIEFTISDGSENTVVLTVNSPAPNLSFKVYRKEGDNAQLQQVTTGMTVVQDGAELTVPVSGIITASEEKNAVLTLYVNDLPKNDSSDHSYTYSIAECTEGGTAITPSTLETASKTTGGTVSLTVKKTFNNVYYKVFRNCGEEGSEDELVTTDVNGKRLNAINSSSENDASSVIFTADLDGRIVVSELYADGDKLTVDIPGLPARDESNNLYAYDVKEYNANGGLIFTYNFAGDNTADIRTLTVEKTLSAAVTNKTCFKVLQNDTAIEKLVTGTKAIKAYKFLVSDAPIGENDLTADAHNRVSITNTLETHDISVALNWDDQGYDNTTATDTGNHKTELMHYPITAELTSEIDGSVVKTAAVTVHPEETPEYEPQTYHSGSNGIIRIPYKEHYSIDDPDDEDTISSNDGFNIGADKAYKLNEKQKVFSVIIKDLPAKYGSDIYTYSILDGTDERSVTVRPAENDKVDLIIEKKVEITDERNFVFSVFRSVNGGEAQVVGEELTAKMLSAAVIEFNVDGLPNENTDDPYVTYKYTYDIIECDENGDELTEANAHDFTADKSNDGTTVSYKCKSKLAKAVNSAPPKYLYYKVTAKVEIEAKKVITLTRGEKFHNVTAEKMDNSESLTFTLQRKPKDAPDTSYETVYSDMVVDSSLEFPDLPSEFTNSSGDTKPYVYRAVGAGETVYTAEQIKLTVESVMKYDTHYTDDEGYHFAVGNGVIFENMPIYSPSLSLIKYKVTESPVEEFDDLFKDDESLTEAQKAQKLANINDYQIYDLYDTVEKDTVNYSKNGDEVEENASVADDTYLSSPDTDSYFSCKLSDQNGTDNAKYYRHYLYQGSAQAYSKKAKTAANSTSTGARAEGDAPAEQPVSHFNILNTLPLTAVTVEKHWDDQNNKFNLRPTGFNDVNMTDEEKADKLNLTIYRQLGSNNNAWTEIDYNLTSNNETEWYTHSYTNAQNQTVDGVKIPVSDQPNEWAYTYYKLLKADKYNNLYNFKIKETKLHPYYGPQYCALEDYNENVPVNNKQIVTAVTVNNSSSVVPENQLDWDGTNPLVETFEITNKLETIDVIVAKSWDDNGYDSAKAANLHYNVKATISSDDIGSYSEYKIIDKTDKNGVRFEDLPKTTLYGKTIVYKVTEDATDSGASSGQIANAYTAHNSGTSVDGVLPATLKAQVLSSAGAESGTEITASNGRFTVTNDGSEEQCYYILLKDLPEHCVVNGFNGAANITVTETEPADGKKDVRIIAEKIDDTNFTFKANAQFVVSTKRYGYDGTCKLEEYEETKEVNGEDVTVTVYQYNILNTLPLTSVKVNKHWDDLNNDFDLRPTGINDKNKGESTQYCIDLTLSRKISSESNWTDLAPSGSDTDWYVHSYTDGSNTVDGVNIPAAGNEWTYTYYKLLKYDVDNNAYTFKITEDRVTAYCEPQYCVASDYENAADDDPETAYTDKQTITDVDTLPSGAAVWDGTAPLDENFDITNKLDTRDIKVYKHWDDQDNNFSTRYELDITLSSTDITSKTHKDTANGNHYKELKTIVSTNDGAYVTFEKLPKYDKDGTVIVYNVREDSNGATQGTPRDAAYITEKYEDASETLTGTSPTFTDGYRHYGYEGIAKYVADSDTIGDDEYVYAAEYHITNTLPVISFTAEKEWDDENNRDFVRPDSVTFTLKRRTGTNVFSEVTHKDAEQTEWKVDFGDQLKYDISNDPYAYKIEESGVSNYELVNTTPTVDGNESAEYVFTNKHTVDEKKLKVQKIWNDSGYKDTIRPELSNVSVELWCRYQNEDEDGALIDSYTDHLVSADSSITAHNSDTEYDDTQTLDGFTKLDDYNYTYEFVRLPVYINLSGTSTNKGERKQFITYYIKESFASNGHVYTKEYSPSNFAGSYVSESSAATGTTLENGTVENPDTIYVKNTPVTRNILVTKEWNDQYYGQNTITDNSVTTSELSKNFHYQTAITLTGTAALDAEHPETVTTVYPAATMYLAKANTDPTVPASYKGVVFKDVPIYDKNGNVITYKVTEAKNTSGTAASGTDLQAPSNDTLNSVAAGEFEQKKDSGDYSYGYEGSAKKAVATDDDSRSYVTRFHITDTLPLTSVTANKHWIDQNNEFGLRPTGINDLNVSSTDAAKADKLNLTLKRDNNSNNYSAMQPTTAAAYTEWYKTTPDISGANDWTFTYSKLLKYSDNNTAFTFQIQEEKVKLYEEPKYCIASEYDYDTDNDGSTEQHIKQTVTAVELNNSASDSSTAQLAWDGTHPLVETFDISNRLETRDITVHKKWDDNDKTQRRYALDITLSSDAANTNTSGGRSADGKYKEVKRITSTENDQYVTFEKLPKYDKNGDVIVYNVREDAHDDQNSTVESAVDIDDKYDGSQTLAQGTFPTFIDGYHHYGYYASSVEYKAVKEIVGSVDKFYVTDYYITNTLPLTYIKAEKAWNYKTDAFDKYRESDVAFVLTRKGTGDDDYTEFNDESAQGPAEHREVVTYSSDSMSARFDELPLYDYSNNPYYYKIQEEDIQGYTVTYAYPSTEVETINDMTAPTEDALTDGTLIADEATSAAPLTIKVINTQILGDASVVKIDQTHYDAYGDHSSGAYTDITLKGAKFALTCNGEAVNVSKSGSDYVLDSNGSNIVESDDNGRISFKDFPLNTYTLTETAAPSGFLPKSAPAVFTIDAGASDTAATATYDSGFVYSNNESENRIGNLQHVEDTEISFVKMDAEDTNIKLANATYYLLQMVPYEFSGFSGKKDKYIAAADQAIKDCGGKLKDDNGAWKADIHQFWRTSDMVNGSHIQYVFTTNSEGKIVAPQYILANQVNDTSKIYRINNSMFSIPSADIGSGDLKLRITGLEASDPDTSVPYDFRIANTLYVEYSVTITKETPVNGKVSLLITIPESVRTSGSNFEFLLQRKSGESSYSNVPDTFGEGSITGIMNGRYVFVEVKAPEGYELSYCKPFVIDSENKKISVEHEDPRKAASLDILKENEYGDPLDGGEFELYYRPNVKTSITYYDINKSVTAPTPESPTYTLNGSEMAVPTEVASGEPTYTYSYVNSTVTPPTATDSNWILPRTDNDYIYFADSISDGWRKYEINRGNNGSYYYDWNGNDKGFRMTLGDLFIEKDGIFADFYDASGKKMGQYSVWERFVDYQNNQVIWKIQPPDGARIVRFHRGWNNYNKQTNEFTFTKGAVYNTNGIYIRDEIEVNNVRTDGIGRIDNKHKDSSGIAYEPTANKIIFRRNSEYCWDNLHIEFFKDSEGSQPVGEQFPGYLMEPYAYADSAYRIQFNWSERYETDDGKKFGNLCYELTIPKEAKYFRINNGTKNAGTDQYSGYGKLYTKITPIAEDTTRKNGGNYWKLQASGTSSGGETKLSNGTTSVELKQWDYDEIVNKAGDTYLDNGNSFSVESDNDFIFFKKPSGWKNTVYAYFYGGGDLRADNWQRAVYSIWPGLIPVGSTVYHDPTTGPYFNTEVQNMTLRVDSTYVDKNGNTIYKFRRPLGDDTNYKKVMFSDGLLGSGTALGSGGGGGHETKVYDAEGGKGYTENGSWTQTSTGGTTETYTFRNSDYIYIVNNNADKWGDIHIKFYDSNGNRVGQGGNGYVMQYAGKLTADEALNHLNNTPSDGLTAEEKAALANMAAGDYYRVPVPANAAKFALDNGNSSYNKNRYTGKYDIQPDNIQIYTITGSGDRQTLSTTSPLTTVKRVQDGTSSQTNDTDYTVRTHTSGSDTVNDYLYLRNDGAVNFSNIKVSFYDTDDQIIKGTSSTYGVYTPTKMNDTSWLRKEIPVNAASFRLTSENSLRHEIYPQGTTGTAMNFTDGDMIYGVGSGNNLTQLYPVAANYTENLPTGYVSSETPTDTVYEWRGDYLDLVVSDNTAWSKMRVTFYKEDGTDINNAGQVIGQYRGQLSAASESDPLSQGTNTDEPLAVGHWFRFRIPVDAAKFKVENIDSGSEKTSGNDCEILPLRTSMANRRQNYTLGGMQYRISDAPTDVEYTLTRFYPVFTETEEPTNPFSDGIPEDDSTGQTADSINTANKPYGAELTRYADIEELSALPVAETPSAPGNTPADTPVLYATNSDTITYEWEETDAYWYLRFIPPSDWSGHDKYAHFYYHPDSGNDEAYQSWPGIKMTNTGRCYNNDSTKPIYAVKIPKKNNEFYYNRVIFNNGSGGGTSQTRVAELIDYGRGFLYYTNGINSDNNYKLYYYGGSDIAPVSTTEPSTSGDNKIRVVNALEWSSITATYYADSTTNTSLGSSSTTIISGSGSSGVWLTDNTIPSGSNYVVFSNDTDSTERLEVPSDANTKNYQYTLKYVPACPYSDQIIITGLNSSAYIRVYLYNGNGDENGEFISNATKANLHNSTDSTNYPNISTSFASYTINHPTNKYTNAIVFNDTDASPGRICMHITLSQSNNYGLGQVYSFGSEIETDYHNGENQTGDVPYSKRNDVHDDTLSYDPSSGTEGTYSTDRTKLDIVLIPQSTAYSATYQPEDRYGYIANPKSGFDISGSRSENPKRIITTDNFIHIVAPAITKPYITFYSDIAGNDKIGGNSMASQGISLKDASLDSFEQPGAGTAGSPYSIRLPKNAKSFKIGNGTVQSSLIILNDDAGSTFTVESVDSSLIVNRTSKRTDTRDFIYIWRRADWSNPPYVKFYDSSNQVISGYNTPKLSDDLGTNGDLGEPARIFRIGIPDGAAQVAFMSDTSGSNATPKVGVNAGYIYRIGQNTSNVPSSVDLNNALHTATIETPAYKTDFDYIYFTDSTDTWQNTSDTGRIYAYYYGGVDGEYMAWPGVPAEGSYTDENGKTVYRFQPPSQTVGEGNNAETIYPYPYVIFNNGSADNRKLTEKLEYAVGYVCATRS